MIQRKQTLFLLAALVFAVCCLCLPVASFVPQNMGVPSTMYNLWILSDSGVRDFSVWPLFAILLLTCPLLLWAVFSYQKRLLQAKLCVVNIFLYIAWYIVFSVLVLNGQELQHAELVLSVTAAFPAVSIIFCLMARHGIIADEKLVRSMDRIR